MYKKIKNFAENCWENKSMFRMFLVAFAFWFIVACVLTTVQHKWTDMFTYPEESYVDVQEEAARIVSSHSFETDYELQITHYSNTDHSLSFELRGGDDNTYITVRVSNYDMENEEVSYKRFSASPTSHIFMELLAIVLVIAFFSLATEFAILILITFLWFTSFVIFKIAENSKQKKKKNKNK